MSLRKREKIQKVLFKRIGRTEKSTSKAFDLKMAELNSDKTSNDLQRASGMWIALVFGFTTFIYWIGFYVIVFWDLYLSWPLAGLTVKALLPVVTFVNFVGLYRAIRGFASAGGVLGASAIALHGVPLIAGTVFIWRLFFGVRI